MYSPAKENMNDWIKQKSRHYTTAPKYPFIKKLLLAIYPFSLILTWICFVSLVQLSYHELYLTVSMFVLYILKWWIGARCLIKLEEKKLALFFPFWDLFYAAFIPILFVIVLNSLWLFWILWDSIGFLSILEDLCHSLGPVKCISPFSW